MTSTRVTARDEAREMMCMSLVTPVLHTARLRLWRPSATPLPAH
ncbi:hypothetical protein ACIQFU_02095 [Streptomyces sp. NPDC093065]